MTGAERGSESDPETSSEADSETSSEAASEAGPDGAAIRTLHEHLDATAELPVDPMASTVLGEADAVAADAVAAVREGEHAVANRRVQQVHDLLASLDGTGHPGADEHVDTALELASRVLAATGQTEKEDQ